MTLSQNPLLDSHVRDREMAQGEAARLASLRDDLTVRYRLGLATFNAASVVEAQPEMRDDTQADRI